MDSTILFFLKKAWPTLIFLSACAPFSGVHPDGFAPYASENSSSLYKAAHPAGITWTIRSETSSQTATPQFWALALRRHLVNNGYRITDSLEFPSGKYRGYAWETSASLGNAEFRYLIGIIARDKKIIIVEAAGPTGVYNDTRPSILKTLEQIQVR